MPPPVAIAAQDVSVSLAGKEIVRGVSFDAPSGMLLGILGPNGAGKTTLLKALAGLTPCSGTVGLLGRPLEAWTARERAQRMAMVAQTVPVTFDFTVEDLVLLGRSPHKRWLAPYDAEDRRIAAAVLEQVDLADFRTRSILTLSGGERRRALLAQALAQDARVFLLDEPTSHLDVHHQFEFMGHVRKLADQGRTVIGVFHDLELAARFADRVIVLQDGAVAAEGTPDVAFTPEMIRTVFRMDASVTPDQGNLRIYFRAPEARGNGQADAALARSPDGRA